MIIKTILQTKIVTTALLTNCLILAAPATALPNKNDAYARADIGYSMLTEKPSSSYRKKPKAAMVGTIGLGKTFNNRVRADMTANFRGVYKYRYSRTNISVKQDIESTALMLSAYYNFYNFKRVSPYLMGGFGVTFNQTKDYKFNQNGNTTNCSGETTRNFAWQLGLGALFKVQENVHADLMYKYIDLGKTETSENCRAGTFTCANGAGTRSMKFKDGKLRAHELSIGIIIKL